MLWTSHEPSADKSVSGDFDQVGLCNPAKASSNTCFHRILVQRSLICLQGKDISVCERERGRERPAEPSNFCKEKTRSPSGHFMHRAGLMPLCTQQYNLSIIYRNNYTSRSCMTSIEIKGSFPTEFKSFWASSCMSHQLHFETRHKTVYFPQAHGVIGAGMAPWRSPVQGLLKWCCPTRLLSAAGL